MNVKCLIPAVFFPVFVLLSCKKVPMLPNYDPRSKGHRIARTWILHNSSTLFASTAADNTRVVISLDLQGNYEWAVYQKVLGVESSVKHRGSWKFIEQQAKVVLKPKEYPMEKCDTFSLISLSTQHLVMQDRKAMTTFDFRSE